MTIQFCTQCKWMLRAAYVGLEFLSFSLYSCCYISQVLVSLALILSYGSSCSVTAQHVTITSLGLSGFIYCQFHRRLMTWPTVRTRITLNVRDCTRRSCASTFNRRDIHYFPILIKFYEGRRYPSWASCPLGSKGRRRIPWYVFFLNRSCSWQESHSLDGSSPPENVSRLPFETLSVWTRPGALFHKTHKVDVYFLEWVIRSYWLKGSETEHCHSYYRNKRAQEESQGYHRAGARFGPRWWKEE